MPTPLRAHAATHIGLVHDRNEDGFTVTETDEGGTLLLVCDGMGGMGRGDEASAVAVRTIVERMSSVDGLPPERMRSALRRADRAVRSALYDPQRRTQPGSTAAMTYIFDGAAHVAWVGDSRAYLIRDDTVVDRTRDHKLVEELIDAGQLTREEARHSALAHVVTRALGGREPDDPPVVAATLGYPWKLRNGDTIMICSDGLSDLVLDDELPDMVAEGTPEDVVERLIATALERGGHDNVTVIVAVWDGPDWIEEEHATPVIEGREFGAGTAYEDSQSGDRVTKEISLIELLQRDNDPSDEVTQRMAALASAEPVETQTWWVAAALLLVAALMAIWIVLMR